MANNIPLDGNSRPLVTQTGVPANITTSTNVKASAGNLLGWVINSHTTGTAKFWDSNAASGTVIFDTITFPSGPSVWDLPAAVNFSTGLYVTLSATINMTVVYV